jgi:hypothetical protein
MLNVYCAHPINGLALDEVIEYYSQICYKLKGLGFKITHPMVSGDSIRTDTESRSEPTNPNPKNSNHAIVKRDYWLISQADIFYLDLTGCKNISIGCVMELAWANAHNKYTIVVMEKNNIHAHAFVIETACVVFDTPEPALDYMQKMCNVWWNKPLSKE